MEKEQQENAVKNTITDEETESRIDEKEEQSPLKENEQKKEVEEIPIEGELAQAKDKYLRLYSEFENYRRRTAKEKIEFISAANKRLIINLLPVLDDMERALALETEDKKPFREGMEFIRQKFFKTLEQEGLKKMKAKKGDAFDDEKHEAITQIPAEKKLAGKLVDIVESGYTLGETVIRFTKVVVGATK